VAAEAVTAPSEEAGNVTVAGTESKMEPGATEAGEGGGVATADAPVAADGDDDERPMDAVMRGPISEPVTCYQGCPLLLVGTHADSARERQVSHQEAEVGVQLLKERSLLVAKQSALLMRTLTLTCCAAQAYASSRGLKYVEIDSRNKEQVACWNRLSLVATTFLPRLCRPALLSLSLHELAWRRVMSTTTDDSRCHNWT
jgi:hypothetical protein